jgi:FAD/FMN-containing dehydrogenase
VQKYVVCGAVFGVAVVGRSGGHSYASYGVSAAVAPRLINLHQLAQVGGQNGSLVIDMTNMSLVSIDPSGSAKIQTGNRLGDIAQKLWDNGQRVLPHGVCPYVCSSFFFSIVY